MNQDELFSKFKTQKRTMKEVAKSGDPDLGPLKLLPGEWKNVPNLQGRGWNMIALPFVTSPSPLDYRLLLTNTTRR